MSQSTHSRPHSRRTLSLGEFAEKHLKAFFTCAASQFHRDLLADLSDLHTRRDSRGVWLAPRGSAKTTWSTFAYPLWCALEGHEKYILLFSDTTTQARKYLKDIRREIEANEGLLRAYPEATGRGPVWRDDSIELRNGVTIDAIGTGGKVRGRKGRGARPTLMIADDVQSREHIHSALQREKSWEWLTKEVLPAGAPGTNVVVLGTAIHREAIVSRLRAGWQRHFYQSVLRWPDNLQLWAQWERIYQNYALPDYEAQALAFYQQNRAAMDAGHAVLWPERYSLYFLMCKRSMDGVSAFASEEQNDPIAPEMCEWPANYFDGDELWFDEWPTLVVKGQTLDPSKGREAHSGDYSAYVYGGIDKTGVIYADADLERRPITQMVEDGIRIYEDFKPNGFLVEANQFQEMLAYDFLRLCAAKGLVIPLYTVIQTVNKEVRIRGLSPYFAQRKVRFRRSPGCRLLIEQLRDFPNGVNDDGADALKMLIDLIRFLLGNGPRDGIQAFGQPVPGRRAA